MFGLAGLMSQGIDKTQNDFKCTRLTVDTQEKRQCRSRSAFLRDIYAYVSSHLIEKMVIVSILIVLRYAFCLLLRMLPLHSTLMPLLLEFCNHCTSTAAVAEIKSQ